MHLRASTRTIPCSGGQYTSFGTPHAYLKTKFQNLTFSKNQKRAWPFRHVYQCLKFWQFLIMITEHHIDLIQVSNSLDLKMTTGPLWGLLITIWLLYLSIESICKITLNYFRTSGKKVAWTCTILSVIILSIAGIIIFVLRDPPPSYLRVI